MEVETLFPSVQEQRGYRTCSVSKKGRKAFNIMSHRQQLSASNQQALYQLTVKVTGLPCMNDEEHNHARTEQLNVALIHANKHKPISLGQSPRMGAAGWGESGCKQQMTRQLTDQVQGNKENPQALILLKGCYRICFPVLLGPIEQFRVLE